MLEPKARMPQYLTIDEWLDRIPEPYRAGFNSLLALHADEFSRARGSSRNHQAWLGGYLDHVREVMNIASVLYDTMNHLRPLTFPLSDVQVVLFIHDLEKPWAYEEVDGVWQRRPGMKESAHDVRLALLARVGITLPLEVERAVFYVEGEGQHYNNSSRGMSPLAAFCHICDVASARVWHDRPKRTGESWGITSQI